MRTLFLILICTLASAILPAVSVAQDGPPLWEELFLMNLDPIKYGSAVWGDFNNDGRFDVIYTGTSTDFDDPRPGFEVFVNMGLIFRTIPDPEGGEPIQIFGIDYQPLGFADVFTDPLWRSTAAWGDLNNDGRLDVIGSGTTRGGQLQLQVYFQTPPGNMRRFVRGPLHDGLTDGDIVLADIDNDGDQDIILSGYDSNNVSQTWILENNINEGGFLINVTHNLANLAQGKIAVGDYDGDSDMDILITGVETPQRFVTKLYRNDGAGNFTATADQFKPLMGAAVDWGDFDADGDLDILYSGGILTPFLLDGDLAVYENLGGSFSPDGVRIFGAFPESPGFGRYRGSAEWGDFNNDGYLDFLIAGGKGPSSASTGQTFQNMRNGSFGHSTIGQNSRFSSGLFGTTTWGDFDDDGDLDILSIGVDAAGGDVSVAYRNNLFLYPRNTIPTPPASISTSVNGSSVTLSWTAGSDSETPEKTLSYNVRIGTAPGAQNIFSAMADSGTGRRFLAARGNVENNLDWSLKGLAPGTYFWSVQTIDTSFKGSSFATEGSFTISE